MDKDNYFHLVSDERWTWEKAYKKWFWLRFTLLVVALGLSVVMAYIYFVQLPKYQKLAEGYVYTTQNISSNVQAVNEILPQVDTTDWKTYESTKYGFSFKYPPVIQGVGTSSVVATSSNNVTEIDVNPTDIALVYASTANDIYNYKNILDPLESSGSSAAIKSIIMVNGKPISEMKVGTDARVLFKHNSEFYVFSYDSKDATTSVIARDILSTFAFSTPTISTIN